MESEFDESRFPRLRQRKRDRDGLHKRGDVYHCWLKVNGRWVTRTTGEKDYQEAKKARSRLQREVDSNRLPNEFSRWTFAKALELYLQRRTWEVEREGLAKNTLRIDKERSVALLAAFSNRVLDSFTIRDIESYQQTRSQSVSGRTINMEIGVLRGVLKTAKLWDRIAEDYMPLAEKQAEIGRALTDEEERLLLDMAASKDDWQVAFLAAVAASNTSMRGSEIKGLRLRDIDFEKREPVIRKSKTDAAAGLSL